LKRSFPNHRVSIKSSNSRWLFVTVMAAGVLAMGAGNSAQAGYQVAIETSLEAAGGGAGACGYNFGIPGGCAGLGPDTTGSVTPPTTPPGNSGTATAASAGVSGGSVPGSGSVSADLSRASVHLAASSAVGNGTEVGGSLVAEYGNYSDTLHYTVAGAGPTTVTPIGFTFTIDGSMSGAGPFASGQLQGEVQYAASDARFYLLLDSDTGYQTAIGYLDTYPSDAPGNWTHNAALTQFTYTDTLDVTGASGSFPMLLDTQLNCQYGVVCDYGDTLQVALNLPSDVTLTSDSGVFPTGTPYRDAVTDPSSGTRNPWLAGVRHGRHRVLSPVAPALIVKTPARGGVEAMNRGWETRNSTVGQLLQVERAGIPPLAVDPARVQAIPDADKPK
jgi:hypothetical protein